MKRKDFILAGALSSLAFIANNSYTRKDINTAGDIQSYLRNLYPVNKPSSVDQIIIGDHRTKIRKAGTVWTPYFKTLKDAISLGINVLIVHEPTFYRHLDLIKEEGSELFNIPSPAKEQYLDALEAKKKWIETQGLAIIRCHDVLDIIKKFGVPFALGDKLGFKNEDILRSKDYYNVYRIEKEKAYNVAKKIAYKLKDLGQPGVAFYGDPNRYVSSIGIGTGAICDPRQFAELEPDLCIAIDDTIRTWIQTTYSEDTGNHIFIKSTGKSLCPNMLFRRA